MKLILDTLEAARLAASPSDALRLADALADLHALADALDRTGYALDDAGALLDAHKDLCAAVTVQPFDLTTDDDGSNPVIEETTPCAFVDWLAALERLAE
jgi:hypothetical protein